MGQYLSEIEVVKTRTLLYIALMCKTNKQYPPRKEEISLGPVRRLLRPIGSYSIRIDPDTGVAQEIHKVLGNGTGLGICRFMQEVLKANESLPKHAKLTDNQIYGILQDEYPHSKQVIRSEHKVVSRYRAHYNHGGLVPKEGKPKIKSYPYTKRGEIANGYTGKPLRGAALIKVLEEKEKTAISSKVRISKIR